MLVANHLLYSSFPLNKSADGTSLRTAGGFPASPGAPIASPGPGAPWRWTKYGASRATRSSSTAAPPRGTSRRAAFRSRRFVRASSRGGPAELRIRRRWLWRWTARGTPAPHRRRAPSPTVNAKAAHPRGCHSRARLAREWKEYWWTR